MNRQTLAMIISVGLGIAPSVFAGPQLTAKVTKVGTYGDGRLFVAVDTQILEPGCPNARFDVAQGHPQLTNWTAVALSAIASGKSVSIQTNGCMGAFPTTSQTTDSFFYLLAN